METASKERSVTLAGWEGPRYPVQVRGLKKAIERHQEGDKHGLTGLEADSLVAHLREEGTELRRVHHTLTDDGYRWFCGFEFRLNDWDILVLIPDASLLKSRELKLERLPAVFYRKHEAPGPDSAISVLDDHVRRCVSDLTLYIEGHARL